MPETFTFDHYEVLTRDDGSLYELGRGAMGITYKAFDTSLRIPVALKVINGTYLNSEVARQRFVREARSAAKLRHRHVASVFHLGIEGDAYFYAMEFIDGETVDALIKRQGPLPPLVALQIAAQVARALNAAQPHGLIHRDIKPANLMLVREDEDLMVKVIDFGLAKCALAGDLEEDAATVAMGFVGTPHFASPEQLQEKDIDVRSDIYSLGVTLWYMLAGQTPFAGSMEQVMSQHISRPPPFEKLANTPAPVSALLASMLAKDAAARPQTPTELRKEIEACMEQIAGSSSNAAQAVMQEQVFATMLDDSGMRSGQTEFEAGSTIAGRYCITASLGETNTGRVFRAEQLDISRSVRLLVLNRELTENPAAVAQIELEVERVAAVQHPNLLGVYGVETIESGSFIVFEWTEGFSLLELLRARRELTADEVLTLLPQAAAGVDQALGTGLKRLDLALHQIFFHFENADVPKEELLRRDFEALPPFTLKLNPLGITRELSLSETWAGAQTLVGGGAPAGGGENIDTRARYVQSLGAIVYELLGGTLAPFGFSSHAGPRYTPLATLPEAGNDVLRRALDPAVSFASAHEFHQALSKLDDLRNYQVTASVVTPPPRPPTRAGDSSFGSRTTRVPAAAAPAPSAPPPSKLPLKAIGGVAAAVLIGGAAFYFSRPSAEKPRLETTSENAPATSDAVSELATSPADSSEPMVAEESPSAPLPSASTRQELVKKAAAEAESLEKDEDWPRVLSAWLSVAKDYPEFEIGKVQLELVLERLRARTNEVNATEFPLLRPLMVEAAELGVTSAMLMLGFHLREREPEISFKWYSSAAARDHVEAITQTGLMLSNGEGCERDVVKAVTFLQLAADRGYAPAMTALAECYLYGKGVPKDEPRAIKLLNAAVEKGHTWAMDSLGTCYHRGIGVTRNFEEAVRLYTKAADAGYLKSLGNLGVLHINGQGVKANPKRAAELFFKGSRAGDPYCTYLYARCLENGIGVTPNALQAETYYRRAAEAGDLQAIQWCRQHNVDFKPPGVAAAAR